MIKTKIFILIAIIIVLAIGVLSGIRLQVQQPSQTIKNQNLASITSLYVSPQDKQTQATVVYYSDESALLTISNTQYQDIKFMSRVYPNGITYEGLGSELSFVEKGSAIIVYKDQDIVFEGKEKLNITPSNIADTTWKWQKTVDNSNDEIIPENKDAFSISFSSDGKVSGTTDCNNFSGIYVLEKENIVFGSFMSTLMACEDSQEQEFVQSLQDGVLELYEDNLILKTKSQNIYFEK